MDLQIDVDDVGLSVAEDSQGSGSAAACDDGGEVGGVADGFAGDGGDEVVLHEARVFGGGAGDDLKDSQGGCASQSGSELAFGIVGGNGIDDDAEEWAMDDAVLD